MYLDTMFHQHPISSMRFLIFACTLLSISSAQASLRLLADASDNFFDSSTPEQVGSAGTVSDGEQGANDAGSGICRSSASFGELRAYAESHAPTSSYRTFLVWSAGRASFADDVIIDAPGLTGQTGTLTVKFTITGELTSSSLRTPQTYDNSAKAEFSFRVDGNQKSYGSRRVTSSGDVFGGNKGFLNQEQSVTFGFVYGTPFEIMLEIIARSDAYGDGGGDTSADLENTATWGGFGAVKDKNGTIITAYTVSSTSDFDYSQALPDDYKEWTALYPAANLADRADDFDSDGMTNAAEHAFGLNPTVGSSLNPIISGLSAAGQFTYTRRSTTGMHYSIWTSADLKSWIEDTGATSGQNPDPPVENIENVAVTLSTPPVGSLFVRVKAE